MNVEQMQKGKPVFATMIRGINNPAIAKIAKQAGLDAIMVDMEHGSLGVNDVEQIASVAWAIGLGLTVRVPELARGYVSRVLDCGAHGVMVPMLETEAQARQLAGWAKYAPVGERGLSSLGGHTDYSSAGDVKSFMATSNRSTLAIAQIETAAGVKNADAIAAVEGIDLLLIGPNDLAGSLGYPGELEHPDVEKSIGLVATACRKHHKIFGMHAAVPMLARWRKEGLTFLMHSMDLAVLNTGFQNIRISLEKIV